MPMQPSPGDVHVNTPLTSVSVAYMQDQSEFIADKVFPNLPVDHQSDLFWVYDRDAFLADEAQERAPGSQSAGGGYNLGTGTYFAKVWAFHKDIDDQTRRNADSAFNLDRDATQFVTQKMLIRRENLFLSTFLQAGVWGTDFTPAAPWNDYLTTSTPTSNPILDVTTGRQKIKSTTGYRPNILVVTEDVDAILKNHPAIIERIKYTSGEALTDQIIARFFEVDDYLVAGAVVRSGKEGARTTTYMATKKAFLGYRPASPSLLMPSCGYHFSWNGYTGMVGGIRVKSFRMEENASDRFEAEMAFGSQQVSSDLGFMFNNVVQ